MSNEAIKKSGWLIREESNNGALSWKKRWSCVEDGNLAFYKKQSKKQMVDKLDLRVASKIVPATYKNKKHCWQVQAPDRTTSLLASSESEMVLWIKAAFMSKGAAGQGDGTPRSTPMIIPPAPQRIPGIVLTGTPDHTLSGDGSRGRALPLPRRALPPEQPTSIALRAKPLPAPPPPPRKHLSSPHRTSLSEVDMMWNPVHMEVRPLPPRSRKNLSDIDMNPTWSPSGSPTGPPARTAEIFEILKSEIRPSLIQVTLPRLLPLHKDNNTTPVSEVLAAPIQDDYGSHYNYVSQSFGSMNDRAHNTYEENLDNVNGHHIPFWQIKRGKLVGEGSYGKIYCAEYNNQTYAIKQFKDYEAKKESALKEAEALMNLTHTRIVSLLGITTDPTTKEIMLVMEYMENGSLEDLLVRNKTQLSREDVIQMGLDIAEGLHFLHAQKIIHRDLKSANVLLCNNKKRAKLSDFGTVRIFGKSSKATTILGTFGFMAPEIIYEEPYDAKADVYSFGAVLYHMLTLKMLPTMFKDSAQASTKIKEQVEDVEFQELIIKCLKKEPEERPTIDECIASLDKMQYEIKP